ncbi:nicastrin isoform X2 [Brachionus plicatilis]|uniref:Nicastrin n=1 Tax=Brachionus plicatilis TaxID=10195 RepID=A0A3M7SWE1_BRAPC|nr:nicastrin isoform X2 [Brachionus plicatilis]
MNTFFFFLSVLVRTIISDLNKERTYVNLLNTIPCIRRFNSSHQIGCGKLDYSSYEGIVYSVRDKAEFGRLEKLNKLDIPDLVVVTLPSYFAKIVQLHQHDSGNSRIQGIVLVSNLDYISNLTESDLNLSDDSTSPNSKFSLYSTNKTYGPSEWNPSGTNFMFQNFNIPFYTIYDLNEIEKVIDECYDKFNQHIFDKYTSNSFSIKSSESLCGMQLGLRMTGAVSSTVCTRRSNIMHTLESSSFCDPLGGSNYFTFLSQRPSNDLPITILSARLDAFSLYEYFTPAANEPISSLIGLFGITELLAKQRSQMNYSSILVVLFDNEAFDYGGSSRFASDLVREKFPEIKLSFGQDQEESFVLKKNNITSIIELGQLGAIGFEQNENLYIHRDPISYAKEPNVAKTIKQLTDKLTKYSSNIKPIENINQQLPTSSIHSFLRNNILIGGISLADFNKEFNSKFYHGVFDTPENMNVTFPDDLSEDEAVNFTTKFAEKLQGLTTSIAQTIFSLHNPTQTELSEQVSLSTLNRLVYCFYKNTTCKYFQDMMTTSQWKSYLTLLEANLPKGKLSFYTGVDDNPISGKWLSSMLLRYFSRNLDLESLSEDDCSKDSEKVRKYERENHISIRNFYYVKNSTCVASSIFLTSSVSPAFDQFEKGVLVETDKFPAWTESSWNGVDVQMKIFMFTRPSIAGLTLSLGIVTLVLAFVLTFLADKFAHRIFYPKDAEQNEIFD